MCGICQTPQKLLSVIGCSCWGTFRTWSYVWCLNCLISQQTDFYGTKTRAQPSRSSTDAKFPLWENIKLRKRTPTVLYLIESAIQMRNQQNMSLLQWTDVDHDHMSGARLLKKTKLLITSSVWHIFCVSCTQFQRNFVWCLSNDKIRKFLFCASIDVSLEGMHQIKQPVCHSRAQCQWVFFFNWGF